MDEIDKLIISESSDCEMDLYEIIYDIHFLHPEYELAKKYNLAVLTIIKLAHSNFIEVIEQTYERSGSNVKVSSERVIERTELIERLKHPKVWDRADKFSAESSLVVVATKSGVAEIET